MAERFNAQKAANQLVRKLEQNWLDERVVRSQELTESINEWAEEPVHYIVEMRDGVRAQIDREVGRLYPEEKVDQEEHFIRTGEYVTHRK